VCVSSYAAVVAIAVSLLGGFYYARWLRAERSLKGAKRDKGAAGKNAWTARLVLAFVAVVLVAAVRAWLAGKGR
jgi:NADH:ubiquinone oxidoreductase subunit 2 (subunit N)